MKKYNKNIKNKSGFTLVELVITIVVLTIIATVSFLKFKDYNAGARDTKRLTDLNNIKKTLYTYESENGLLPKPENEINIKSGANIIGYQGDIGEQNQKELGLDKAFVEPQTKEFYAYNTNAARDGYALTTFFETSDQKITEINNIKEDENKALIYILGNPIGVLLDKNTSELINKKLSTGDNIDIENNLITADYKVELGKGHRLDSDKIKYLDQIYTSGIMGSCKQYIEASDSFKNQDGVYLIENKGDIFEVYCDMTTDGGGWTLFGVLDSPTDNIDGSKGVGSFDNGNLGLDNPGYSLEVNKLDSSINKFDLMIKYGKNDTFDLVKTGIDKDGVNFFIPPTGVEIYFHGAIGNYTTKIDGEYGFLYCAFGGGCLVSGNDYLNLTSNFASWYRPMNTADTPYGWSGCSPWYWGNTPSGDNLEWQRYFIRY